MLIMITGLTGFIGQHLLSKINLNRHQLIAVVRKHSSTLPNGVQQVLVSEIDIITEQIDCFINLAGENIAAKPWSKSRKLELYGSRVTLTEQIARQLKYPPKKVISMSAIGFYGDTNNDQVDEFTPAEESFTHQLCHQWEQAVEALNADKQIIFRLGVVLGKGGALVKMRPAYLMALGGKIGDGNQWFSWVHIEDVVQAILIAINTDQLNGIYNLTAPTPIRQNVFAQHYATSLKRPSWLTTPKALLNLLLGEMSVLLTQGAAVYPKRLLEENFDFQFKTIDEALLDIEKHWSVS
ncbi:TIGR01777 family oxidoreductase [Marinomonas sp.]